MLKFTHHSIPTITTKDKIHRPRESSKYCPPYIFSHLIGQSGPAPWSPRYCPKPYRLSPSGLTVALRRIRRARDTDPPRSICSNHNWSGRTRPSRQITGSAFSLYAQQQSHCAVLKPPTQIRHDPIIWRPRNCCDRGLKSFPYVNASATGYPAVAEPRRRPSDHSNAL